MLADGKMNCPLQEVGEQYRFRRRVPAPFGKAAPYRRADVIPGARSQIAA
jgi:hypothetical protein